MTPGMCRQRLLAIALALVVGGCSAAGKGNQAATRADDGLRLVPDPAFAGARLAVVFTDPNLRADRCRFEWRRNRYLISEARTEVLEPTHFAKGDRIEVAVVTSGVKPGEIRRLHALVEVANTPPTVTRVTVLPATTGGQAELRATPEAIDRDGDPLTFAYRWLKNGVPIAAASGAGLPIAALGLGDQITVEVVASDGESESPPVRGEAVPVENRPPQFTSQPAAPAPADTVFRYQAVAVDADRDPLRYELVKGPSGMVVNADGSILWALPALAQRGGEHAITIRALDTKGGEATQQFTIRLGSPIAKK